MKLGKMFMSMSNIWISIISQSKLADFPDDGTKIQDGHRKKTSDQEMKILHDTKQLKASKMV